MGQDSDRRQEAVEQDVKAIFKAISQLTIDMKLMTQSTITTQRSMEEMRKAMDAQHEMDKRLQAVEIAVDHLDGLPKALETLNARVTSNESVATIIKWVSASVGLSAIGVIVSKGLG